jgi:hypothetical protein
MYRSFIGTAIAVMIGVLLAVGVLRLLVETDWGADNLAVPVKTYSGGDDGQQEPKPAGKRGG